jgi:hypothetical protein
MLFNVDDLCPTNAPKRCEWCKGPYHIRKRCPALATLSNETQRKKRAMNYSNQEWNMDDYYHSMSNYYQDNANWRSNKNNHSYNNGRNHPNSAPPNQQPFRYTTQNGLREFYNSNEQQMNNSQHRNSKRNCFRCGSTDHMKAQCPLQKKPISVPQPKSSS